MTVATDPRGRPISRRRHALLEGGDLAPLEVVVDALGSRPVMVVGAAPIEGVLRWTRGTALVTVNGSISTLRDVTPDVHLINARIGPHVTWNKERRALNAAMVAQSADRHVRTLALLPVTEVGAEEATLARLRAQGTTWDRVVSISKATKVLLAHAIGALDRERDRHLGVSAGLFGVCVALWAGASSIRTEGFSFDAGYAYLPPEVVPENSRGHLRGDKTAIANIRARFGGRVAGDLFTRRMQQTPRRT
jgi:hypothetical protein